MKPRLGSRGRPQTARLAVDVVNLQRQRTTDTKRIRAAVQYALRAERVRAAHLEIAIVDDTVIRRVHREFLGADTPTDVITFPMDQTSESWSGHIVVSMETAIREAARRRTSPHHELLLYCIHGVLHLCGYDDRTARDARRMRRRQELLLREFNCHSPTPPRSPGS